MPSTKLRQDTIRSLEYFGDNNSQCIYWDEALPAFGVRVYPNERRTYVSSYRVQGRKRLATLGRADVLTLDEARKKARRYLVQVADGSDPQAEDEAQRASGTVKSLATLYIEKHAKPRKRSWRDDESALNRYLIPKLGSHLASTITNEDISQIHSEIGKTHPYAANRLIEVVRRMYNLARKWRVVRPLMQNPAVGIERYPETKRRRFATAEEMPRIANAIDAEFDPYIRNALWLLLLTGLRTSELLRSKWSDVDWNQRTLEIGKTKNGEALLAPLSRAAIARLKSIPRLDDNPYIVCGPVKGQHLASLTSPWQRVRSAAGTPELRLHDLRRTVGSWLVRDGATLHLVGAVLNHKDQKTTAGYAYFQTQDRRQALDKHGRNILSKSKQPKSARATTPDSIPGGVIPGRRTGAVHEFTRQRLYKLVWSKPVSSLAKQFGISDVGLAKACKRAQIPLPMRGYWAKVAVGQRREKTALPPPESGKSDRIVLRARPTVEQ